jgi:hypothetical protein
MRLTIAAIAVAAAAAARQTGEFGLRKAQEQAREEGVDESHACRRAEWASK